MSSPKNRRKNATILPSSPSSMNPFMTFLNTNKLSTIQRTMQSRKLFNKINKVNAIISDEKIKWNSSQNVTDLKDNQNKFLMLINKNQAPLQINPRIRMRKTIENLMKSNKIESPLDKQKSQNLLTSPRESDAKASLNKTDEADFKSIKRSIKQISQISRYFDRVYKIDKKQKYLKIDTIDYWKRIETTPSKKKELIDIYNRVHKDEKFTFSEYQRDYETKWLEILKNLQEKDKATILFLINGGHHEEDIEEQIRMFDPNKIIQRLEYKKFLEEKKNKQSKVDLKPLPSPSHQVYVPKSPKPIQKTPSDVRFATQRQSSFSNKISRTESKSNGFKLESPSENKGKSVFGERTSQKKKTQTYASFQNIPEVTSPAKSIRSQVVLKNFLHDNMPQSTRNIPPQQKSKMLFENIPQSTKSLSQQQKSKISLDTEKIKLFQAKETRPQFTTVKRSKRNKIKDHSNDFQECNCKHAHNILCYQLKKDHKSIFKIPSVLPPTRKTFMEIRRASNMPYSPDIKPKIDFEMLQHFSQQKERETVFLEKLKTNINDSYDMRDSSPQKNNFILEK